MFLFFLIKKEDNYWILLDKNTMFQTSKNNFQHNTKFYKESVAFGLKRYENYGT